MKNSYFIMVFILIILFLAGCAQQQIQQPIQAQKTTAEEASKGTIDAEAKSPSLKIISPSNNELIRDSKVTIKLEAENFNIVPIGSSVKVNEGHFHAWLDSERKVTTDSIIAFENITSGRHQIVAELVKSDHSSLSPKITQILTVNVESDYVPPLEQVTNEFTIEADDNDFYPNRIQAKIGETVKINFKFRDSSIYFAGLDVKGPFEDIKYKLKGEQPITREFVMKGETIVKSFWPASGVKKAELIVEVER